jgi:hypothetical protein
MELLRFTCRYAVDKSCCPIFSLFAILIWGPLGYVNVAASGTIVCESLYPPSLQKRSNYSIVNWLLAISGLSTIFTWMAICLCQYVDDLTRVTNLQSSRILHNSIRFRQAWVHQGHSVDELPFRAIGGVYGSWFGVLLLSLVLIAQFYVVHLSLVLLIQFSGLMDDRIARRSGRLEVFPVTRNWSLRTSISASDSCHATNGRSDHEMTTTNATHHQSMSR